MAIKKITPKTPISELVPAVLKKKKK